MNAGFNERTSKRNSGSDSEGLISDPERLVEVAQTYFSSDFPNISRADCPAQSVLDKLILSKALPPDELRAHLFGCSECFRDYRRLVALHRGAVSEQNLSRWGWMTISLRPHPVSAFTGLILLAVCLFAVFFIGRSYLRETPTSIVRNTSQPATGPTVTEPQTPATGERISDTVPETSPAGTSAEKQSNRGHEQRKERPSKELIASNTVTIDLEKNSLLRSSDATSGETTIKLPAARNRLNVVLPANSPKALYKLSVVDAFGRELLSRSAASADGKRLTTNIDMRALSASKYRLCVSLTAEAPDCYPFIVTHK